MARKDRKTRKSGKARRKAQSRFEWLGMPEELMTGKVKVKPFTGANMVKGPKLERTGFARIKVARVRPLHEHLASKPTMAEIVAAVAVKKGSKAHIEPLAKKLMAVSLVPKSAHLLGMLVAASAISYSKGLPEAVALGDGFIDSIANTPFDVEVSSSGRVTTRVGSGTKVRSGFGSSRYEQRGVRIEVGDHVSVTKGRGKTIYHFDSLNFYFTAQFINEVNIDSDRVFNFIEDQVNDMSAAVQQKLVVLGGDDRDDSDRENDAEIIGEEMSVRVSNHGAELQSLIANGHEYLWHGDPTFWSRRAPILFPIVGRLADDKLRINGHEYTMKQHGFARDAEFELNDDGEYVMVMSNNESIKANYPYDFDLRVRYDIKGDSLNCNWQVRNLGEKTMCFQIGAHPAFLLPDFDAEENLHGFIRFYDKKGNTISPLVYHYLDGGLRRSYDTPMALNNDEGLLALNNKTFENDALLIEGGQVASAALLNKAGHEVLRVSCPQAEAFGVWAPNKPDCPFVCIEPWCGIADRVGFNGDIKERDCIHCLMHKEKYNFKYSISVVE